MADAKTIDASSVPVEALLARYREAKKAREKYDRNWERNHNFRIGKHWEGVTKIAWFQSEPMYNKVAEYVELERASQSDNKWGIDAIPSSFKQVGGKDPREMAEKANKLIDWLWEDMGLQRVVTETVINVLEKGTGFIKASFDPENISNDGIGQLSAESVDPFYVYPDPDATSVHDAAFIIQANPVSLRYIMRRWPEKLAEIKQKGGGSSFDLAPRGDQGLGVAPTDEGTKLDILECWYHDATIIELDETDDEVTVGAKYPNGRYTLMTSTGVILEDKPNPYNRFPYIRIVDIPNPGEFWGGCTLDQLVPIQQTINSILRSIIDNGLWLVHGIWVADSTSGVSARELSTYGPRDVVVKNPGSEVRRDGGDQLPPHLFEALKQQVEAFDQVAGLNDPRRGIVPSRQPVATVAQQTEAGELRTRERGRRIEEGLTELGEFLFELVREHWVDARQIGRAKATGGYEAFELSKEDFEGWEGKIRVRPGSTQPVDRAASLARCAELQNTFGVQIPQAFLIDMADVPGLRAAMDEQMSDMAKATGPDMEMPDVSGDEGDVPDMGVEATPPMPPDMGLPPDMGVPPAIGAPGVPPLV